MSTPNCSALEKQCMNPDCLSPAQSVRDIHEYPDESPHETWAGDVSVHDALYGEMAASDWPEVKPAEERSMSTEEEGSVADALAHAADMLATAAHALVSIAAQMPKPAPDASEAPAALGKASRSGREAKTPKVAKPVEEKPRDATGPDVGLVLKDVMEALTQATGRLAGTVQEQVEDAAPGTAQAFDHALEQIGAEAWRQIQSAEAVKAEARRQVEQAVAVEAEAQREIEEAVRMEAEAQREIEEAAMAEVEGQGETGEGEAMQAETLAYIQELQSVMNTTLVSAQRAYRNDRGARKPAEG